MPATQATHVADETADVADDDVPAGQFRHAESAAAAAVGPYVPLGQGVQLDAAPRPVAVEYVPRKHDEHVVEPAAAQWPAEHKTHEASEGAPPTFEAVPMGQLMQVADELAATVAAY